MIVLNISQPSDDTIRTVAMAYGAICGTAQQLNLAGKRGEADMVVYAARLFRNSPICDGVTPGIFDEINYQFSDWR
jgi:hypothetical protein